MNDCQKFGEYLRSLRLERRIGLREFARNVDILPSNYHHIEAGFHKPPQDEAKLTRIILALDIAGDEKEKARFFDLHGKALQAVPLDVAQVIKESDAIPMLLRTIDNRKLSEKEICDLVNYVRGIK